MRKRRPCSLWVDLSGGQRETQEPEVCRPPMKGEFRTGTGVSTAKVSGFRKDWALSFLGNSWGRHPISHGFSPSLCITLTKSLERFSYRPKCWTETQEHGRPMLDKVLGGERTLFKSIWWWKNGHVGGQGKSSWVEHILKEAEMKEAKEIIQGTTNSEATGEQEGTALYVGLSSRSANDSLGETGSPLCTNKH